MIEGIDKKTLWFIGTISVIVILLWGFLFYYLFGIISFFSQKLEFSGLEKLIKEDRITEDVLNQFRATGEGKKIPEKTLKNFRTSGQGEEIPADVLEKFRVQ